MATTLRSARRRVQHARTQITLLVAVALSVVAAIGIWWCFGFPTSTTASAQTDSNNALEGVPLGDTVAQPAGPPLGSDAVVNTNAALRPRPISPDPPPPPLLTEKEVEEGINVRLQRMHARQAAREARESQAQQADSPEIATIPAQDPPREPYPPPPPLPNSVQAVPDALEE